MPHRSGLAGLVLACLVLGGCADDVQIAVGEPVVVTWEGTDGATMGQVIVSITNEGGGPVDPDVFGRGSQTVAHLLTDDGRELAGGDARVQLHAVPELLGPGESGYLLGTFEIAEPDGVPADARIELNAHGSGERVPVTVDDVEIVTTDDGIGVTGHIDWNGAGTAVARAIAFNADGEVLGYAATDEARYVPGDVTMCCFPPGVDRDEIDDVVVIGVQADDEN